MATLRLTSCVYLRCKSDTYIDPLDQAEESAMPRFYWCGKTLKSFGPDSQEVDVELCQPGRQCFCKVVESASSE